MYKSFFHLDSTPFADSPDPRFLVRMAHTREALATLEYGIGAHKGFIVLTGEVGTGKTTLLRAALASFEPGRVFSSFVFNPRLEVLDFFEFILADFGIVPQTRTKSGMLIQLNRWLVERFRHDETCVIVIDEAQNLTWEQLEEVRLLTNLETPTRKLVQIVLSGQPELEEKLSAPDLRQLRQRIALWARTHAISADETSEYITQRLLVAGSSDPIFLPTTPSPPSIAQAAESPASSTSSASRPSSWPTSNSSTRSPLPSSTPWCATSTSTPSPTWSTPRASQLPQTARLLR